MLDMIINIVYYIIVVINTEMRTARFELKMRNEIPF